MLVPEALSDGGDGDESTIACVCRKIICAMLSRALKDAAKAAAFRAKRGPVAAASAQLASSASLAARGMLQPMSSAAQTLVDTAAVEAAGKAMQYMQEPSVNLQAAGLTGEAVVVGKAAGSGGSGQGQAGGGGTWGGTWGGGNWRWDLLAAGGVLVSVFGASVAQWQHFDQRIDSSAESVKQDLKQDLQTVKQDLKQDLQTVKQDLKQDLQTVTQDLQTMKQDLRESEGRMGRRMDKIETRLEEASQAQVKSFAAVTEALTRMEMQQKLDAAVQRALHEKKPGSAADR